MMHDISVVVTCVLILVALVTPGWCAEYYVSPAGDDQAEGTRAAPWRTLAKVSAALEPGDTAVLLPGTYEAAIRPKSNGEPGAAITYRSHRRHAALVTGGRAKMAINLDRKSYVTIDGLRIATDAGRWVQARLADHIRIVDCRMDKASRSFTPVSIYDSRHVWLVDNTFAKQQVSGNMCDVIGCTFVVIEGNAFSHVGHCPLRLEKCNRVVVRANCFHNPWGRNYELVASGKVLVERNIVTEALDSAHSADSRAKNSLEDSIIRLNRVFGNQHTPLCSPSYVPMTNRVTEPFRLVNTVVYHNTIVDNFGYGWLFVGMNISKNMFMNNLFSGNAKHGSGVQIFLDERMTRDNQFHHSLLRGERPGQTTVRYGDAWWTTEQANRATPNMRQKWTQFTGNIDAAPAFIDPANHDYRLRSGSACIDAARPMTKTMAAGEGRALPVDDARYFFDGFGIEGERGDLIAVGKGDNVARVVSVAANYYQPDVITLDRDLKWQANAPVSLPWTGKAPDMGAYEKDLSPIAVAKPARPKPGEVVKLAVRGGEEEADGVEWDFADGATASGARVEHTFDEPGHYPARVLMRPGDGSTRRDFVFVKAAAPATPGAPMLTVDFEGETLLEWGFRFKFHRQRYTGFEHVNRGPKAGACMRLFAERKGAILGASLAPGEWDIDAYPFVRFSYRIPKGSPVGLCFEAFPSKDHGSGRVMVGGSESRAAGPYPDTKTYTLIDDGQWRDITLDARMIRQHTPDIKHIRLFRFYTHQNATKGHEFWFDDFAVLPDG